MHRIPARPPVYSMSPAANSGIVGIGNKPPTRAIETP
jgi:hypothetical protein